MNESTKATFAKLDGTPAHILVILGLFLMLLSPLIMNFKTAGAMQKGAAAEQADEFIQLDLKDLSEKQDVERKQDEKAGSSLSPEDLSRRQQDRQKAYEDKQRELKQKYNAVAAKREFLEAQADLVGTRIHYIATFLGALCLLIGLIVMTVQATGTTQKVLLIILLVVMFSALSGINLNIEGKGNLGGRGDAMRSIIDAMPRSTPPPSSRP
jgi:Flp pilus assembly protein TadB